MSEKNLADLVREDARRPVPPWGSKAGLEATSDQPRSGQLGSEENLTLENAPFGTRAPAFTGGHWVRVVGGWKWFNSGPSFPRPGGDWDGRLLPPTDGKPE